MAIAQVVQLSATNIAANSNINLVNVGRMYREGTLYTYTERHLTYGEGLANTRALAAYNNALKDLDTLLRACLLYTSPSPRD